MSLCIAIACRIAPSLGPWLATSMPFEILTLANKCLSKNTPVIQFSRPMYNT